MRRRDFIVKSGIATLTAASWRRVRGANDRVGVALVGSGRRGREVMKAFLDTNRAELKCICDVYDVQRERATTFLSTRPVECVAIEEALTRPGIDAVLISTPDHLHLTQTITALKSGKHVFLEKPTSHHFGEAQAFVEAVKQSGKVCQTGTQQRSGAHYRKVKDEFFDRGRLGHVVFARAVWHDFPWQRRTIKPQPKPEGLDWERFLGPAKHVPYEWIRYDAWRYFPEYGGGLLADILTHWADVAQWMMNDPKPVSAVSTGGIYELKDGRVNPDTVNAIIAYDGGANGKWNLTFESSVLPISNPRPGIFFQGTEGTLELARTGYIYRPNKGDAEIVDSKENLEIAHVHNFLDAIKNGSKPSADIQTGIEACRPVHLAKAAYWERKRMRFDSTGTRIVEDT